MTRNEIIETIETKIGAAEQNRLHMVECGNSNAEYFYVGEKVAYDNAIRLVKQLDDAPPPVNVGSFTVHIEAELTDAAKETVERLEHLCALMQTLGIKAA